MGNDSSQEYQAAKDRADVLEKQLAEAATRYEGLIKQNASNHDAVAALTKNIKSLLSEKESLMAEVKKLAATLKVSQSQLDEALKRHAQLNDTYEALMVRTDQLAKANAALSVRMEDQQKQFQKEQMSRDNKNRVLQLEREDEWRKDQRERDEAHADQIRTQNDDLQASFRLMLIDVELQRRQDLLQSKGCKISTCY